MSTAGGPALNLLRIEEELSQAHLRLAQVYVENMPFGGAALVAISRSSRGRRRCS